MRFLPLFFCLVLMSCAGSSDSAKAKAEADRKTQIPAHETWCYSTMGDPVCTAHPQDTSPSRLIAVDPPGRTPLDAAAYHRVLAEESEETTDAPTSLIPIPSIGVDRTPITAPTSR